MGYLISEQKGNSLWHTLLYRYICSVAWASGFFPSHKMIELYQIICKDHPQANILWLLHIFTSFRFSGFLTLLSAGGGKFLFFITLVKNVLTMREHWKSASCKSLLCHYLIKWSWAIHFTSLGLSFLSLTVDVSVCLYPPRFKGNLGMNMHINMAFIPSRW